VHEPVLVEHVVSLLQPHSGGLYVDCTAGAGGHSDALLTAGAGRVIALDRDEQALAASRERLSRFATRIELVHADFRDLAHVLHARGIDAVDGVVADFGVSSMQLDEAGRGFSFRQDGPLDMRMDRSCGPTAAEMIQGADERTLADVIYRFGEERRARRVASAIVRARQQHPLARTAELATIVRRAVGAGRWQRIDPATRTFQALRIWVNHELDGLDAFIVSAVAALRRRGRLAVIAFHSLEDRIVKQTLFRLAGRTAGDDVDRGRREPAAVALLTRKPVVPDEMEIRLNPRARSARLRAVEKVA
jgi:16S rRNA (cytosine1402-N4)-methyltransferase